MKKFITLCAAFTFFACVNVNAQDNKAAVNPTTPVAVEAATPASDMLAPQQATTDKKEHKSCEGKKSACCKNKAEANGKSCNDKSKACCKNKKDKAEAKSDPAEVK